MSDLPPRRPSSKWTHEEVEELVVRVAKIAAREAAHDATKALEARITSLEMTLKSGKGILVGAAAVLGFMLAGGIAKLKALLGIM
jgi:hypothetical protein